MMRQGCNQAANFTHYNNTKTKWMERNKGSDLMSWQHLVLGCANEILGATISNPVDAVKTRLQRLVLILNQAPKYASTFQACSLIAKECFSIIGDRRNQALFLLASHDEIASCFLPDEYTKTIYSKFF
mmetsp:Transcript_37509/g.43665  ORF Transcript_37509/g.43665 Transcript_37509/m.43665 type:complete len:128 (+) Transcript_37509:274-657(+)